MFLPPAATAMYIHRWNRRNSKKSASKGRHLDTAGPRHSWTQAQLDSGTAGLLIYFHFLLFLLSLSVYAAWNFTNPWFTGMLGLEIITYFNDTNTWVSDSSTSVCLSVSSNFLLVNWDQQHQCGCRGRAWERGMVGMKNWGNWTGYSALGFQTWGLLWTTLTSVEAWVCWQLGFREERWSWRFPSWHRTKNREKTLLALAFFCSTCVVNGGDIPGCPESRLPSFFSLYSGIDWSFPRQSRSFREVLHHPHLLIGWSQWTHPVPEKVFKNGHMTQFGVLRCVFLRKTLLSASEEAGRRNAFP